MPKSIDEWSRYCQLSFYSNVQPVLNSLKAQQMLFWWQYCTLTAVLTNHKCWKLIFVCYGPSLWFAHSQIDEINTTQINWQPINLAWRWVKKAKGQKIFLINRGLMDYENLNFNRGILYDCTRWSKVKFWNFSNLCLGLHFELKYFSFKTESIPKASQFGAKLKSWNFWILY